MTASNGFSGSGPIWFVVLVLLLAPRVAAAQALTGSVSVLFDHLPNRDATEMRARAAAEKKWDAGPHVRFTASGLVEGLVADRNGSVTDAIVEPRDLLVEFRATHLNVAAGVGRVVWGRLDELQPTDVINPLDVSRFFFEGRSEARLAVPLVRATVYASDKASVEGVYVPFFRRGRFDQLDEPTSPFNLVPGVGISDAKPARTAANAQGGARVNLTTGRTDWSVSVYRGFRSFGLFNATGPTDVTRLYPRFTMIGGDVERAAGAWVVRGETALFVRDAFQNVTAATVQSGSSFDAGGGVDRKAGAYRVSAQVLVHVERYDVPLFGLDLPTGRTDVSLIASTDRSFARERYSSRVFGVYNPSSGDGFLRGIFTATLRDNLALEGSIGWFAGDGPDTIGRFADSDFGYLRLKYFF